MKITVSRIDKVEEERNSWSITKDDGWSFWLEKKYGIIPKVGDEVKILSYWGSQIHGIQVNGRNAFWLSKKQADAKHQKWAEKIQWQHKRDYKKLMTKIIDEESFTTVDISGMGGGYERTCQLMLRAGLKYLENKPNFVWDYKGFENIYGLYWSDSENSKRLNAVLTKAVGGDCTGAMHQAVIGHLCYIHKHSYQSWLRQFKKDRQYTYPKELPAPTF